MEHAPPRNDELDAILAAWRAAIDAEPLSPAVEAALILAPRAVLDHRGSR